MNSYPGPRVLLFTPSFSHARLLYSLSDTGTGLNLTVCFSTLLSREIGFADPPKTNSHVHSTFLSPSKSPTPLLRANVELVKVIPQCRRKNLSSQQARMSLSPEAESDIDR